MCKEHIYSQAQMHKVERHRYIGVLQQLQQLLYHDATLRDIEQVVQGLLQEFGGQQSLETVIQHLVSRSLQEQHTSRLARRAT